MKEYILIQCASFYSHTYYQAPAEQLALFQTVTMATRWGIASAGLISHDFTNAIGIHPSGEHKVGFLSFGCL